MSDDDKAFGALLLRVLNVHKTLDKVQDDTDWKRGYRQGVMAVCSIVHFGLSASEAGRRLLADARE